MPIVKCGEYWRAVYDGRYRFLIYTGEDKKSGAVISRKLLFDMTTDPMEVNDLSENPAHADNLRRLEVLLYEQRDLHDHYQPAILHLRHGFHLSH